MVPFTRRDYRLQLWPRSFSRRPEPLAAHLATLPGNQKSGLVTAFEEL